MGKHTPGPKELQRIALRISRATKGEPNNSRRLSPGTVARITKGRVKYGLDNPGTPEVHLTESHDSKPISAPVTASAPTKESTMKKNRSVKRVKKTKVKTAKRSVSEAARNLKAAKAKTTKVAKEPKVDAGDNKTGMVTTMLLDAKGCTAAEVCKATGWAAVSIPPIAKRNGIELRKEPEGRGVRYFGTRAAA